MKEVDLESTIQTEEQWLTSHTFAIFTREDVFQKMPSERQILPKNEEDGTHIDYLDEDPEIPTQKYCIISFLSPEKTIKQKQEFMFERFIEWMDYEWKIKGLEKLMAFLASKYELKVDDLFKDAQEFTKVHNDDVKKTDIHEQYQVFQLKNEKELQEMFDQKVEFQTNMRGVKVRRCFGTVEETQMFAKVLQRRYPKDNLFIGKVGAWLPWDPSEHLMPEVEYAEKELNELMRRYKENEVNKEMFFADQREESIKKQKEENERRKKANALEAAAEKKQLQDIVEDASKPVHPSEGVMRE